MLKAIVNHSAPTPARPSFSETLRRIEPVSQKLAELALEVDQSFSWPTRSIQACRDGNVFRWFLPQQYGGWNWNDEQILLGYLELSQRCLTTAFILTQWHAACRRLLNSNNQALKHRVLPRLADGSCFVSIGISQITTSHQHTQPALQATRNAQGFELNGFSPWVTAAPAADLLILGATLEDGQQLLAAVTTQSAGVHCHPGARLLALPASCTDRVELSAVQVGLDDIVVGPCENVMSVNAGQGGGSGGLHTSILALGLAMAACAFLREQSAQRSMLRPIADKLSADVEVLLVVVRQLTLGNEVMTTAQLRRKVNSIVLRSTQAALQAAKGAGFVIGHPAGRWAQQALFFLVWSCPQAVFEANLCDLAGIENPL
jgi:alkylation response protein AidB-like acyl-CoA dehydrogenase